MNRLLPFKLLLWRHRRLGERVTRLRIRIASHVADENYEMLWRDVTKVEDLIDKRNQLEAILRHADRWPGLTVLAAFALTALATCDQPAPPTAPDPDPPPQPAVLQVHPQSLYFDSVGAVDTLRATVLDQYGAEMSVSVAWASADPTIAGVRGGVVTARDNGRVKITASVDTLSAFATISVDDPVFDDYAPDRAILERFFREANGDEWVQRAGWADDDLPMSEWAGVTVGFDSAVGKLRPERISLVGAKCDDWIDCPHSGVTYDGFPLYLTGLERLRYLDLRGAWWGADPGPPNALAGIAQERVIPEAIMEWESLDSVHLSGSYWGYGGLYSALCVPRAQVALTEWLHARENIPARDRPDRYQPYWKTRPCMEAADIDSVQVFIVQASELNSVLFAGRRATVVVNPIALHVTAFDDLQIDDSTWQKNQWRHWPTVKARWCVDDAPCVPLDLQQRTALDTLKYPFSRVYDLRVCSTEYQPCRADELTWISGVASDTLTGAHITDGGRLHIELWSKTVGDTVLLYSRELVPEVLDESRLEVTLVVQIPWTDECFHTHQTEGNPIPDDCHEWPDSAWARYDSLMADDDRVWRAMFQQTEHWFGTKVDVKWHDEPLLSPPPIGIKSGLALVSKDMQILREMQRQDDDGRYWIGIACLVGHCSHYGTGFALGAAELNGRIAVSIPYGPVIAHELGHNFGLEHPDQMPNTPMRTGPLAFGLWSKGDHFWEETYVDAFVAWRAYTFMQSTITSDSRIDGQSIAAWQFANVRAWLWGEGIAHEGPRRVVVNE